MRRALLWLAINCAIKAAVSSGGDKSDKRRADVARVAAAGPTEPCWGSFTNGSHVQAKRSGNYRNAEFFASRLAIRRRSREFFQTALGFVEETARCADIYLGVPKPKLAPPFERYNDRSFACPARPRYHGSGRIEGYWDVLFCEPCVTPRREVDKRISRRRLQDALHIDAPH